MYKIKYEGNIKKYCTLFEAFTEYKKLRSLAWWELDTTQLKIFSDDDQDITQVVNDFLDGRNRRK